MKEMWGIQRVIPLEQLGLDPYDILMLDYDRELRALVLRASIRGTKKDLELALWRLRYELESMEKEVRAST